MPVIASGFARMKPPARRFAAADARNAPPTSSANFTQVAIGSGDHLFAEEAARLAAQGVWVTVLSRRRGLSPWLERAASEVIFLDNVGEAA